MGVVFYLFLCICFTVLLNCQVHAVLQERCSSQYADKFCVYVSNNTESFRDADLLCRDRGASLVTVKSLFHQKSLISIIRKEFGSTEDLWFGLYSSYGRYHWTSGEGAVPNVYFVPDQKSPLDACFALNAKTDLYTWKSVPCDVKLRFICGPKPTKPANSQTPKPQVSKQCPPYFHYVDGACFMIDSIKANWSEAALSCPKHYQDATLASVTSLEQQDYLSILLSQTSGPAWIGLSLSADEHNWKRGDAISFTNWIPSQPSTGGKPLCTAMLHRPHHLGQWEDTDCATAMQFICQAPVLPISVPVTTGSQLTVLNRGRCDAKFMEFDNRCYQLVPVRASQIRTLSKEVCPMRLAPHTLDEVAFMRILLGSSRNSDTKLWSATNAPASVWVGISFTFNPSAKLKVNFSVEDNIRDVLPLSVYEKLTLTELLDTSRTSLDPFKRCAALSHNSSSLEWIACDTELPSICGYSLPGYNLHPTAPHTCPSGWSRLGNKCYSPLRTPPATWAEAESACLQLNASLVSLHDQSEHQFLGSHLRFRRVWLGLRVNYNPLDMSSYWSDLSPVDYVSFAAGQPARSAVDGAIEGCTVLRENTHDWDVVHCDDRHDYVCQLSLVDSKASNTTELEPLRPQEFCTQIGTSQFCVEFHSRLAAFVDAEEMCRSRSKTLATIPSEEHHRFLMDKMRTETTIQRAYIGLFSPENTLMWVSSYPSIPVFYWRRGAPEGAEQCVFVQSDGQNLDTWDFGPCTEPLAFICSTLVPVEAPPTPDFSQSICPGSYMHIGSGCFLIKANAADKVTWTEASAKCAQLQPPGRLASIQSLYEQDGLSVLLASAPSLPVWIGLKLEGHIHRWQDGSQVTFTNWAPGNPSGDHERCALMNSTLQSVGEWTDATCDWEMGYICQTNPISPTPLKQMAKVLRRLNQGGCVDGYYQYRNRCYTVSKRSESESRSPVDLHDDVSGKCLSAGHVVGKNCAQSPDAWGTVSCPVTATAHTAADAAFIRLLIGMFGMGAKQAWVGLKLNSTSNSHLLISEDGSALGASTSVAFETFPDAVAIPGSKDTLSCLVASADDVYMRFVPCTRTGLPVVCSYELDKQSVMVQPAITCPRGWIMMENKCFLPAPKEIRLSWDEAEQACQKAATEISPQDGRFYVGHLASVHSLKQQSLLTGLLESSSTWLGLRILANAPRKSVHFVWSDQSAVDFLNLNLSESQWARTLPACLTLDQHETTWQAIECYQPRSYLCQLTAGQHVPTHADDRMGNGVSSCQTKEFPHSISSSRSCYHVAEFSSSWNAAEAYCRGLDPNAHLASIRSEAQMQEIATLLSSLLPASAETWFGLHEDKFAYAWADQSPVNFVSLSADLTKENRQFYEDCFALVPDHNQASAPSLLWTAVDCSSRRSGLICELSPPEIPTPSTPEDEPSTWKPILCPPGYRQYANRCFALVTELLTWNESNQVCVNSMRNVSGFSGSLATIDSGLVQEFVASLLDNLPVKSSSAWIGLTRTASEISPNLRWADGSKIRYLRSTYRVHRVPIFDNLSDGNGFQLCTAISRSTYPRINGLWLQMSCNSPTLLPSVCQAIPSIPTPVTGTRLPPSEGCPIGFYLGTTGFMWSSALSKPTCYRLLTPSEKMDWETANTRCRQLSTPEYNVSVLSVASVFEASFLRAWLRMPRSLGGAELPSNEPVWSGLRVPDQCPQCFGNWSWNSTEPVRYTDWLVPPTTSPSGCYVFHPDPYHWDDPMSFHGLGSLRPESTCKALHYVACQVAQKEKSGNGEQPSGTELTVRFADGGRQPVRPRCFQMDETKANAELYRADIVVSASGKSCLRWDLIPLNLSNSDWILHRTSAAVAVGSDGTPSYAENFCSLLYNVTTSHSMFGCYVSLQPLQFELCQLTHCPKTTSPLGTKHWVMWMFLVFILIGVLILAVGIWRGCTPLRRGYRRYFPPSSHSPRFTQRGPVHFTASKEPRSVFSIGDTISHSKPLVPLSTNPEKDLSQHPFLSNEQVQPGGSHEIDSGHFTALSKLASYPGATAYHNPIYTALPEITPEDDYDPEA